MNIINKYAIKKLVEILNHATSSNEGLLLHEKIFLCENRCHNDSWTEYLIGFQRDKKGYWYYHSSDDYDLPIKDLSLDALSKAYDAILNKSFHRVPCDTKLNIPK